MKPHILKVFNDSYVDRDVWALVTIVLCRNMAFDGIKFMKCAICASMWFISLLPHAGLSLTLLNMSGSRWFRAHCWAICSVTAFVLCSSSHCSTTAAAPVAIRHTRTRGRRDTWGGVVSHFTHSLPALLGVLQGKARRLTEPAGMQLFWAYCGWGWGGLQLSVTSVADASRAPTLSQRDYD